MWRIFRVDQVEKYPKFELVLPQLILRFGYFVTTVQLLVLAPIKKLLYEY
jgi:hypothetical protein